MNFRRQPFQFTAIDPAKRQAELQKRFGLPINNSDMYVDFLNPGLMGSGMKEPSLSSGSPRLQHRVPIFTENADKATSEQNNVDGSHKPRVRVVPIQVEGVDGGKRHRTFSGPAGMVDGSNDISKGRLQETFPHLDSARVEEKIKKPSQPRVCNIPIHIEPREEKPKVDEKPRIQPTPKTPELSKNLKTTSNGCAASKQKVEPKESKEQKVEPNKNVPLKQIENVLKKLEEYKEPVEKFSGTSKDKQYRYLDEMLTRCMLDLDNVDTMGLDEIRKARKEAVRQVQHYVDLLDTKVNAGVEKMESEPSVDMHVEESKDGEMACDVPAEEPKDNEKPCGNPTEASKPDSSGVVESEDVEMSGDAENINEPKDVGEVIADVDMDDEKSPEVTNEKMEVSAQDGETMDSATMEHSSNQDVNKQPESDITSTSCNEPVCENKSGIVIEELDNSLEGEFNVGASEVAENENVSCIVSHSPELGVKETILEEDNSDIVIEEIEDNSDESKDSDHSNAVNNSSVKENDEKLTFEQLNIKGDSSGVTSAKLSHENNTPVVQESES